PRSALLPYTTLFRSNRDTFAEPRATTAAATARCVAAGRHRLTGYGPEPLVVAEPPLGRAQWRRHRDGRGLRRQLARHARYRLARDRKSTRLNSSHEW